MFPAPSRACPVNAAIPAQVEKIMNKNAVIALTERYCQAKFL